jgi:RNA polymerase sigma factor (sigma-70 family)
MGSSVCHSASLYFTNIAKLVPISDPTEERRLIQRWQKNKDILSRDTLIQSHLRFVVTLARKRSRDVDRLPDLIAAGNLGLLKAIDKYDLKRKPHTRFLTYAGWWIQKEIADEDYATSSLVHVPTHRQKAQRKRAKEFQKAVQSDGPDNPLTLAMDPGLPEGMTVALDELRETEDDDPDNSPTSYDIRRSNGVLRRAIDQRRPAQPSTDRLHPRDVPRACSANQDQRGAPTTRRSSNAIRSSTARRVLATRSTTPHVPRHRCGS